MMLIISAVLICLLVTILWTSTQPCFALYFGHTFSITKDKQPSPLLPNQLALTQKGSVYIVWDDNGTIYLSSSQDNENKFGPRVALSDNSKLASSPQIAATEKGNVYVIWIHKNSTTGHSDVVFRTSNDSGRNFSITKELGSTDLLSFPPQITATEKGNVYVIWVHKNSTTGHGNIAFRSSNDSGDYFSNMKELGDTNVISFSPQIATTEKGNVHVVWVDIDSKTGNSDIAFKSSNDSGENFAQRKLIRTGKVLSLYPQISATEKGNVHIVWVDIDSKTGNSDIAFKSSNDSGENFAQRKLIRAGKVLSFSPQIAATEKGDVYVVWIDKNSTTGSSNIAIRSSINNGEDFDSRVYLNRDFNKIIKSFSPQIAATEKGHVYVVWIEDNVQFKEILDKGNLFGQTITLSNKTSSSSPHIAVTENGNVYVTWADKNSTTIGESLLFKRISEFLFNRNS